MAPAAALARLLLLLAVAGAVLRPTAAEIKQESFKDDSRANILFEKFGFSHRGSVSIALTGGRATSKLAKPDPAQLGFLLLSDEALFEAVYEQPPPTDLNPNPDPNSLCVLASRYVIPLFTFAELDANGNCNKTFPISHPDEYSLFFANCAPETAVTMEVRTDMYNTNLDGSKDYLSVGQAPVPTIYAFFALGYVAFLAGWLYLTLYHNRLSAHRIHHLMSCLLLARMLYCISAAEDQHYIRIAGSSHGWDVMFYLFQLVKGVILFAVIALIGTGWSFLKPFLQDKEKKVLMVVIPLQVAANIAAAVVGETGQYFQGWVTWNQIFLFVDVACCCAVLFPVVWSMRSLRESSKTDGKAARTLAKLTLFRQFYVVVIGYLYFTRIIVYALKTITNYKYRWVSVAAEEVATMAFYMFMFYMFKPAERNSSSRVIRGDT
uniref:Predicted protein n=1 Tax=Hordeum vulgare subsp. vulgare TaxID=112509 RepID=F2DUU6_HORVV|nr:predicted protein [Hordeum vulgare subsp. vulgare]